MNKILMHNSLFIKIILLFCVIGLVFIISSVLYYHLLANQMESEIQYFSSLAITEFTKNVKKEFSTVETAILGNYQLLEQISLLLTEANGKNPDEYAHTANRLKINNKLGDMLYGVNYANWVCAVDLQGNFVLNKKILFRHEYDLETVIREYNSELAHTSGEIIWRAAADKTISLMKAIYNTSNMRICGYIIANIENTVLADLFSDMDRVKTGDFIIYDSKNAPMLSTFPDDSVRIRHENYNINTRTMQNENIQIRHYIDLSLSRKKLLQRIQLFSAVCVLCILLVSITIIVIFLDLAKNVRKLLAGIENISSGNLHTPIAIAGNDITVYIAKQINTMSERIAALMAQRVLDEKKRQETQYQLLEFQYNALQSQINPHFLFNVLESINAVAKANNDFNISNMVCRLAKLLRDNLDRDYKYCTVEDEIKYIKNYIALYELIYPEKFTAEYDIHTACRKNIIPTFILQPIIENALVHGLKNRITGGKITVSARRNGRNLLLSIHDNGDGISRSIMDTILNSRTAPFGEHKKVGLSNINERIKLLYGNDYSLKIASKEQYYTRVAILLPSIVQNT